MDHELCQGQEHWIWEGAVDAHLHGQLVSHEHAIETPNDPRPQDSDICNEVGHGLVLTNLDFE